MKKHTKIIVLIIAVTTISSLMFFLLRPCLHTKKASLVTTKHLCKKSIAHVVQASGDLEIKNPVKLGSIVSGIVKKINVEENTMVTKGQLLLKIDPGTGETEFKQAYNEFLKAKENYHYLKKNFIRKEALYTAGQLAGDEYELAKKNTLSAEYSFKSAEAKLDKEQLLLNERNIYAPQDGFVTKVTVTKGSGVSGSNVEKADPLVEITPDFTTMEIKLNVDESDIGSIQIGQRISVTFNAYPDQRIESTVKRIGFSPKKIDGIQFYKVYADIPNEEKKLRPGMLFNAKIYIAEKEAVPSLHGFAFQINPKSVEAVARKLNFDYKPLSKVERKKIKETSPTKRIKFVWVNGDSCFKQKAVTIGTTDNNYFEILEGLSEADHIITDIVEDDNMNTVYKKWFSGPF